MREDDRSVGRQSEPSNYLTRKLGERGQVRSRLHRMVRDGSAQDCRMISGGPACIEVV